MATPKTETFSNTSQRIAELAKALGHPARIEILKLLAERNACICGDLVSELPLSQATVSQHLKALKSVGLIQGNIDGPRVCYCIDWDTWQEARNFLEVFFAKSPSCDTDCNC